MKRLYVNYKGVAREGDASVASPADVDTVLDGIRDELADAGALLMMIGFLDDAGEAVDSDEGPVLQAGINNDRGLLTYEGSVEPDGLISFSGRESADAVYYSFQGTKAEFPASAEVPFAVVKQAIKEFLTSEGALPQAVQWRPDVD